MTRTAAGRRGSQLPLGECRRHRDALLGLLEDPAGTALPDAARVHLDACRQCRERLSELVLTGYVVRRSLAVASRARPSGDAWPRLRARLLRRSRTPGRASSPILGLALSAGLAASLLLPLGVVNLGSPQDRTRPLSIHEAGLDPAAIQAAGRRDAEDEARRLRETMRAGKEARSSDDNGRPRAKLILYEPATALDRRSSKPRPAVAVE